MDAVFAGAGVGLCLLDPRGVILRVNSQWASFADLGVEDVMGRSVWELFPDARPERRAWHDEVRAGKTIELPAVVRRSADGTEAWFEARMAPIQMEDGVGVLITGRNITELRRTERALRESEQRFRLALRNAPVAVSAQDRELRYVWIYNPRTSRAEEAVGKTDLELFDREEAGELTAMKRRVLDEGVEIRDQRWVTRAGERIFLDSFLEPIRDDAGQVTGIGIASVDLTAVKQAEEQLRQSQKLESVGRLAGGVAHDFNNLLTVILSCAESIDEAIGLERPVERDDVEEIRTAANRATDLTRRLLAFARRQIIAPIPLDVAAAVRESAKLLGRVLGEQVELRIDVAPGLWRVCCDPGQLEQVVLNLAVNARDAMPRGGTLTIDFSNAVIGPCELPPFPEATPGEYVRLRVRDTGVGMCPEVKAHLFEPFFTTKPLGQGTGLGLATTYGIVKQSGGGIRVESAPGEGAAFDVYLPRTLDEPPPAHPPAPEGGRGTEPVLVVEDDALVRDVTVRALQSAGYEVAVAAHPQEALDLPADALARTRLLVTDVVMPGLDGPSLAAELRRRHPALLVLYVSGYTEDAGAVRAVDPATRFLPKPFTPGALLAKVREVLDAPAGTSR